MIVTITRATWPISSTSPRPRAYRTTLRLTPPSRTSPVALPSPPSVPPSFPSIFTILTLLQQWLDNNSDNRSLSPQHNSDFSSAGGSPPPINHINPPPLAPPTPSQNPDDEIIPTAIVIKNIPFNVKRETLLDIIVRASFPRFLPFVTQ